MPTDEDRRAALTRELLEVAHPGAEPAWIESQAAAIKQETDHVRKYGPAAEDDRSVSDDELRDAAPRKWRGARIAAQLVLAVVVFAAAVLGITERHWVAETAISPLGITFLVIAAGIAGIATIASFVRSRRERLLSVRVRIDTEFTVDIGETQWLQGMLDSVPDLGMVVVRIKNTGGTPIESRDYIKPVALHFPGRRVIAVDAAEFEPRELQQVVAELPDLAIDHNRVRLPKIGLGRDDSFKLVVWLSGTRAGEEQQVFVEGTMRDGRITTREGAERLKPVTLAWGALTALCAGAFAVVLLLNNVTPFTKVPQGVQCVSAALTVEGSSAFGRAASELAGSYHAYCPGSSIDVRTPGSIEGLRRLAGPSGKEGNQLALSDGKIDDPDFAQLVPHRLAIVPFQLVASANVPVDSLTVDQARKIFHGGAYFWSDITGNPQDTARIRVVGRTSSSGTRRTLERYVIGLPDAPTSQGDATSDSCHERRPNLPPQGPIICERGSTEDLVDQVAGQDDAIGYADVSDIEQSAGVKTIRIGDRDPTLGGIRAGYPFWTVEYVYSRGELEPGSLPIAFHDYLLTQEGKDTMARFQYYACVGDLQDLCARD